jgi:AcrR family transcriptional regulator
MPRAYRQGKRADSAADTRRRIIDAAIDLHRTVGPAQTTVAEIARKAGVGRVTVYKHFPDDAALVMASQSQWLAQHPPPDAGQWAMILDPDARLRVALRELYLWYFDTEPMTGNVLREGAALPAFTAVYSLLRVHIREGAEILAAGRVSDPQWTLATLNVVQSYDTWRVLVHELGLTLGEAVELVVGWVRSVV